MAFLGKGTKVDLQYMTTEMGVEDVLGMRVFELRDAILNSEYFDEEFCREFLNTIVGKREIKEIKLDERKRKEDGNSGKEETGRFRAEDEGCRNGVRNPEKTNRVGRKRSFHKSMPRHRSVHR
ncbi:hypothetical protein TNCV_875221 [Trichonephila clavipes]|nr:hypothetical protein TNCV_875221 [Trichonephila clavipes]